MALSRNEIIDNLEKQTKEGNRWCQWGRKWCPRDTFPITNVWEFPGGELSCRKHDWNPATPGSPYVRPFVEGGRKEPVRPTHEKRF